MLSDLVIVESPSGLLFLFEVFGLLYYSVERQDLVRQMKRQHPTMTMMLTVLSGHFIIYQVREGSN